MMSTPDTAPPIAYLASTASAVRATGNEIIACRCNFDRSQDSMHGCYTFWRTIRVQCLGGKAGGGGGGRGGGLLPQSCKMYNCFVGDIV